MDLEYTLFEKKDGVAIITLNRPDRMNALMTEMSSEMVKCLEDAAADDEVRVAVLTGAGRAFCAGADISKLAGRAGGDGKAQREQIGLLGEYALDLAAFEKPLIAAVNGVAAGGGVSLALACDICIASENARFIQVFVRRGVTPDLGGSYYLARRVGLAKACELVFTAEPIDAREAERLGLVNKVVAHDQLMPATLELAGKIAMGAPLALTVAKRAIYRGAVSDLRSALEFESYTQKLLFQTEDFKEGVRAFMEKREPRFTGQ